MRYFVLFIAIISSISLFLDTTILFYSASLGERLHPELMEHWPFNILFTFAFWYWYRSYLTPKQ